MPRRKKHHAAVTGAGEMVSVPAAMYHHMMKTKTSSSDMTKMIGKAILLASIQASIGSVEMSSKFSVINFSKDQETLQAAANALTGYIFIGTLWTVGAILISSAQYGKYGFITALIANLVMMGWIYWSYIYAFQCAVRKYNLQFPTLFRFG